jgi:hypothetical protein
MSARHARQIEDEPVQVVEEKAPAEPSTPQEYRVAVSAALNNESLRGAQRAAAEGHARFPDDPELARLDRVLTLPPARSVPRNGRKKGDSQKIFQRLHENESHFRGQWILVNEDGLVASAPTLEELLRKIEEIGQDDDAKYNSLIHHVR